MEPKSTPVDRRPDTNAGSASPPHFLTRHEINIDKYDNVGPPVTQVMITTPTSIEKFNKWRNKDLPQELLVAEDERESI